ncbi:hypothetical protein AsFcp4_115 [Aeromonas phage AsFcp_4]|uniref:Uncharacterized protein n=1 Tax=Aeromonas phage PX29 TaxID=926067 RepID=E5DQL7_9CAUD|nr:hypothetical protein CL89_gp194 [Aeromonas phage PX29]ADQ53003.1 conserved hypothetical protein [Aeromonas phage PX29]QAX98540.1 hypothetical protein ASfcp2_204 [Aeromonas phage AsFcp_2]QAX99570.1 hypothetical protein AsFcp4_115 [Aeromonas phage AsFcp_4]
MNDFMIKIGYTLFDSIEQYTNYLLTNRYDEYEIYAPEDFPMYLKLANVVYCDVGGQGALAVFSSVKMELVK